MDRRNVTQEDLTDWQIVLDNYREHAAGAANEIVKQLLAVTTFDAEILCERDHLMSVMEEVGKYQSKAFDIYVRAGIPLIDGRIKQFFKECLVTYGEAYMRRTWDDESAKRKIATRKWWWYPAAAAAGELPPPAVVPRELLLQARALAFPTGCQLYVPARQFGPNELVAFENDDEVLVEKPGTWVFFCDDYYGMQWGHECRLFVCLDDGTIKVTDHEAPPCDLDNFMYDNMT